MTGEEIRSQINLNYEVIDKNDVSIFILNSEVKRARENIDYYQSICPHKYENGRCIFCDTEEPNE